VTATKPNAKSRYRSLAAGGPTLAAALFVAATFTPSQPEAATPRVTPQERARAAQQHPQILAEFGGEITGPLSTYVKGVGEKVASVGQLPNQCVFSVINSDVVNAFAVPGCYIYITRGLLAIMNSEDELASVLGHEVGHITGKHSQKRQQRATLSALGAIVAGIATNSGDAAQAAAQLGQVLTLGYSRNQEFDADDRGVSYLKSSGYNMFAAADMLGALGANDALTAKTQNRAEGSQIPTWARTHPLSADRVARATALATQAGGARATPPEITRPYLQAVNGMIFGDDPEQGYVNGRTFAHPKLKIAFEIPDSFQMMNGARAISISGPNGPRAQFGGGPLPQGGPEAHAQAVLKGVVGQAPTQVGQSQRLTTNTLPTAFLPARVQTQQGQVVEVGVTAYQVGSSAYHFVAITPPNGAGPMQPMIRSMRMLSDAEAATLRPRVVQMIQVGPGDTLQSLASRMAFSDFQVERFQTLNGLAANTAPRAGDYVKIVTYGR
jgi:predicted Zn-dependent protease